MAFARKYAPVQRAAVELAWGDRGIRPAARVRQLAALGELTDEHGARVEPFELPESAVRTIGARYLRRRRAREILEAPAQVPADALEQLRRRLLLALESELQRVERAQSSRAGRPPRVPITEQLRLIARAARELAALPAPGAAPADEPRSPGARAQRGLAAAIVRANASGAPAALEPAAGADINAAPAPVHEQLIAEQSSEDLERSAALRINGSASACDLEAPGSHARAALHASSVRVQQPAPGAE